MSGNSPSIFFVSTFPFGNVETGLARRTALTFRALSDIPATRRVLMAPEHPATRQLCREGNWEFQPVGCYRDLRRQRFGLLRLGWARMSTLFAARLSDQARTELLSMMGGSDWLITEENKELLCATPDAVVWLSRSDLLNIMPALGSGHKVILDSNDSIANLFRVYNPRRTLRRFAGWTQSGMVRLLERQELKLAGQCDLVLAISVDDAEYFKRSTRAVVLEEACATAPEPRAMAPVHDVGFIGSMHGGSVAAARNLLLMAARPELHRLQFTIAGGVCEALREVALPTNVVLKGRVARAFDYFRACRQILLWSSGETGTSVKFQEAILSGTTVIANANAARWSAARPGRDFLLCSSMDEACAHLQAGTRLNTTEFIQEHALRPVLNRMTSLVRSLASEVAAARGSEC
jgi:hypothetical protein